MEVLQNLFHLPLVRKALLRLVKTAHHIGDCRADRKQVRDIDPEWQALQMIHVLRKGLPVEVHRHLHRLQGNRLVARERKHRPFDILGVHRGKTKPTVTDSH